jgi:serine/threonine protein kinase
MGCQKYNDRVDIWSAGYLFIELMTRQNFLRGLNEREQLASIIKFFGTPDITPFSHLLPSTAQSLLESMPLIQSATPHPYLVSAFGPLGAELIHSMCCYNPADRPSAQQLLSHPYFAAFPAAALEVEMRPLTTREVHDFEVSQRRRAHADLRSLARPPVAPPISSPKMQSGPVGEHNLLRAVGLNYLDSVTKSPTKMPRASNCFVANPPLRSVLKKTPGMRAVPSDHRHIMLSLVHEERLYDPKSPILPEESCDEAVNTKKRARIASSCGLEESPAKVYKSETGPAARKLVVRFVCRPAEAQ